MTCHDAREHFSALIDDALDASERAALEAHLATCADCRRELQRFRDTVSLMHGAAPVRAPAGFVDRVLEAARPTPWPRRLLQGLFLPWPIKLPMEAAAIVLVAVGVALVYRGSPELRQAAVQEPAAPVANQVRGDNPSAAQPIDETKPSEAPAAKSPEGPSPPEGAPRPNAPAASPEKQAARSLYSKEDKAREQDAFQEHAQRKESARAQEPGAEQRLKDTQTPAPSAPAPPATGGPQSTAAAPQQVAPPRDVDLQKRMESQDRAQDRQAPLVGKLEAPSPTARQRSAGEGARSGAVQPTEQRADAPKAQRPASPPQATASLSFAPPDVSGQLAVSDREVTLRSLKELVTRVGAAEAYRLDTADGSIIEIAVRREMFAELNRGLARLGRWQLNKEPSALPATVRVVVRITG